jgi:excinuclease ABC subunit A
MSDKLKKCISIRGAKEHNLKNINIDIPRDQLVVITGLSGSGKSSLAFDTIYAEGQRRYVESLSNYARQFLQQMQEPKVDSVEGLPPAIAIDQKSTSRNPRSTVGTVTEIFDYLRLLFSHIGIPHCPKCGKKIQKQSASQISHSIDNYEKGTDIILLAPVVRNKKGEYKQLFNQIEKDGFLRVRVNGEIYKTTDTIPLTKTKKHTIEIVVDRIKISNGTTKRLAESVETALKFGKGLATVLIGDDERTYSESFACVDCDVNIEEVSARMFSFNAPYGSCPECKGLGAKLVFSEELVIPDKNKPLRHATSKVININDTYIGMMVNSVGKSFGFSLDTVVSEMTESQLNILYYGTGHQKVDVDWKLGKNKNSKFKGTIQFSQTFEGIIGNLDRRYYQTESEHMRFHLRRYMRESSCRVCNGKRLRKEMLAVKFQDLDIIDVTRMNIESLLNFFKTLKLTDYEQNVAEDLIKKIITKLVFLNDVGIGYLTLDRKAATLSGGEAQRIRLATQIGSGLIGVVYVLDEPSIGLHQRDNEKLIKTLKKLRDTGNSVIVVEHDEDTILNADHVIDIGPKAGKAGGKIIFEGTPSVLMNKKNSTTAQFLRKEKTAVLQNKKRISNDHWIKIKGAKENNLKNINVKIPLSKFVCISGVSGSGKSSLINEIFCKEVARRLNKSIIPSGKHESISGLDHIDKLIKINQDPIGKTPRSNPATYTGVFDHIRNVFTLTKESSIRGYKPGRFSFNVKGGRCEVCQGDGLKKIEMAFLPDVYVPCEECGGKRYNRETLEVAFKGLNIAEVLNLDVNQAFDLFQNIPKIKRILQTLIDVGLGYIHLGQSSTTLSGGEAQRIKLASELCKRSTGKTVYVLDEPTTGLHFADTKLLIEVLNRLVESGNTVIVIEHNLDVIKSADYLIDLGPDGGEKGGAVVAFGSLATVRKSKKSYTATYL